MLTGAHTLPYTCILHVSKSIINGDDQIRNSLIAKFSNSYISSFFLSNKYYE